MLRSSEILLRTTSRSALLGVACLRWQQAASISRRTARRQTPALESQKQTQIAVQWPRRIFTGIQPTGDLHLGNYVGVVKRLVELQARKEDLTICIADLHAITLPHNPPVLRENIFRMAATLLACGIDPARTPLFVQSTVPGHCELQWLLACSTTTQRLTHLPQYKEKSQTLRDLSLGVFSYPVLQAADIILHKATHVPVGADQIQHLQLTQHLIGVFNNLYGETFAPCEPMIDNTLAARVRSLREPKNKMSKSDSAPKATIFLLDEPEVIVAKIKKAVTDHTSDVTYDAENRPGVSNLVAIHSMVTGQSIDRVVREAADIDTGKFKLRVADALVEHLRPIREETNAYLARRSELINMLENSAKKLRASSQQTLSDVKQRLGLGTNPTLPLPVKMEPKFEAAAKLKSVHSGQAGDVKFDEPANEAQLPKFSSYKPIVPQQKLRLEKAAPPVRHQPELRVTNERIDQLKPLKSASAPAPTPSEAKGDDTISTETQTSKITEDASSSDASEKVEVST